jgi:hypothetical protein
MVRKADRHFECVTLDDPDLFLRIYIDNMNAQRTVSDHNIPIYRALIAACLARDSGRIYAARESDGTIAAAVFCAWDGSSSYYLMSTRTLGGGNSATTFLLWNAIKDAAARGFIFDFDGVASAGAVMFYAGFGATIQPRYIVSKSRKFFHVFKAMQRMVEKDQTRFF